MWKRRVDDVSGRVYTYPSNDAGDLWLVCTSTDGKEYYHNVHKNITAWDLPEVKEADGDGRDGSPDLENNRVAATPSPPREAAAAPEEADTDSSEEDTKKTKSLKERLAAAKRERQAAAEKRKTRRAGSASGSAASSPQALTPQPRASPLPSTPSPSPADAVAESIMQELQVKSPSLAEALQGRLSVLKSAPCPDCLQPKSSTKYCPSTGRSHDCMPTGAEPQPAHPRAALNTATEPELAALLGESATSTPMRKPVDTFHPISPSPAVTTPAPPAPQQAVQAVTPVPDRVAREPETMTPSHSYKTITLQLTGSGLKQEFRMVNGVSEEDQYRVVRARLGIPVDKPMTIHRLPEGGLVHAQVEDGATYYYDVEDTLDVTLIRTVLLERYHIVGAAFDAVSKNSVLDQPALRHVFSSLSIGHSAEPFLAALTGSTIKAFAFLLNVEVPAPASPSSTEGSAYTPTPRHTPPAHVSPVEDFVQSSNPSNVPLFEQAAKTRKPASPQQQLSQAVTRRKAALLHEQKKQQQHHTPQRKTPASMGAPSPVRGPATPVTPITPITPASTHASPAPTSESLRRDVAAAVKKRRERNTAAATGPTGNHESVTYPDGSKYEGGVTGGIRQGYGRLTQLNQNTGKPESIYDGQWKDGRQHGEGSMAWAGKGKYEGQWAEGKMHGKGKVEVAGVQAEATMDGGRMTGRGVVRYPNGDVMKGKLQEARRGRDGGVEHANGDRYQWKWKDEERLGSGVVVLKYKTGDEYEGEVRGYKKHGKGVFKFAAGHRYEGDFADGDMAGQGTFQYADGGRYTGEMAGNVFNGEGTFLDTEGQEYTGSWHNGRMHGMGVMTFANGDQWEGLWEDDVRGDGRYIHSTHLMIR